MGWRRDFQVYEAEEPEGWEEVRNSTRWRGDSPRCWFGLDVSDMP